MYRRFVNLLVKACYKYAFRKPFANKTALVSYVPTLFLSLNQYFRASHNNTLACFLICKKLNELGFSVHLRNCNDINFTDKDKYDLFIGHTRTFDEILAKITLDGPAYLLVTGSEPVFGNGAQWKRSLFLSERRGVSLPPHPPQIIPSAFHMHQKADLIMLLGNRCVMDTWYPEYREKYSLINNVSCCEKISRSRSYPKNFLFLSSTGQVLRGLDLLLDVFSCRQEKLYVCSDFEREKEFVSIYYDELYKSKNIIPVGHVDLNGNIFRRIVEDCSFVILLSCSEGQSSSVINAMLHGLIPIVTPNVGLPEASELVFLVENIEIAAINKLLDYVVSLDETEIQRRYALLADYVSLFSIESHRKSLDTFFSQSGVS